MGLAFGVLHFPPDVFWSMTFREWQATLKGYKDANGGGGGEVPLKRDELEKLMEEYPDVG